MHRRTEAAKQGVGYDDADNESRPSPTYRAIADVAHDFGCSRRQIERLARKRGITLYDMGSGHRQKLHIRAADIERLAEPVTPTTSASTHLRHREPTREDAIAALRARINGASK